MMIDWVSEPSYFKAAKLALSAKAECKYLGVPSHHVCFIDF